MLSVKQKGVNMFGLGENKGENMPTPDNSKQPRKRRTQLEIAQAKEEKGNQLLDEAKAIRAKVQKAAKEKERKQRLFPVSGILLKIIDDMQLPEGVTDADYLAALRIMLCEFRRHEGEEKSAYRDRLSPAIDAIFGNKDQRTPVIDAAIRVLTGHTKAAESVSVLHKSGRKSKTETNS